VSFSTYERFKWEVLADLFHRFGLDAPWHQARNLEPDDAVAQDTLVRRAVLDLFDSGLIFGAYASRQDGYEFALQDFEPVAHEVVVAELDRDGDYVEPEDRLFWLLPAEKAEQVWQSLPAEAFLRRESARREKHRWALGWARVGIGGGSWSVCRFSPCRSASSSSQASRTGLASLSRSEASPSAR
jgi:hypothetical protein